MYPLDKIRAYYNAEPFAVFDIVMADGRRVPVHGREYIAFSEGNNRIGVIQPDDSSQLLHRNNIVDVCLQGRPSGEAA
ncbi:MAG: hypothetical protein ACPGYV_13805 [Phycisphaeraceae bacterium]